MPRPPTVLVIDDEADCRRLLGEVLRANGWQVLEAEEGETGLIVARESKADILICDLLMPRTNGFRVCREVRSDPGLRDTRIIVMSGRDFESDRQAALEAGADAYLTKPLDLGQLVETLACLTAKRNATAFSDPVAVEGALLRFWGVRGSIPTPGPGTVHFGGNTSCVEVRADGQIIILDAGSGLRLLGQELVQEFGDRALELTLLLTHTHWDHIQGIPFFLPVYRPQNRLRILGYEGARHGLESVLSNQMESPFFPVGLREVPANVRVEELKTMSFEVGPVRVQAAFANHPGICVGYRLFTSHGSIAFFPDNEPRMGHARAKADGETAQRAVRVAEEDGKLIDFLRDVDVLIMDAQYDCVEYKEHVGWGHGCLDDVVALGIEARAKQLFLFHHDPNHTDDKISSMQQHAQALATSAGSKLKVSAAREGERVELLERALAKG